MLEWFCFILYLNVCLWQLKSCLHFSVRPHFILNKIDVDYTVRYGFLVFLWTNQLFIITQSHEIRIIDFAKKNVFDFFFFQSKRIHSMLTL